MACPTKEQLARLALGLADKERLMAHVEQCEACRARLADVGRITEQLSAAHSELDRGQADSRARLLANISKIEVSPRPAGLWNRLAGLTLKQRIAAASVSLLTVAALVLILLVANSTRELSAMERLAKRLQEVKSYSYKLKEEVTMIPKGKTTPEFIHFNSEVFWRAPGSFREEIRITSEHGADAVSENQFDLALSRDPTIAKLTEQIEQYKQGLSQHLSQTKRGLRDPTAQRYKSMIENLQKQLDERRAEVSRKFIQQLGSSQDAAPDNRRIDTDIFSIAFTDKPGIFIDRKTKSFSRVPEVRVENTLSGSLTYPLWMLRIVREDPGKLVRDLGTKQIRGKEAHGYMTTYPDTQETMDIWVDPQTDLPLEIRRETKDESTTSVIWLSDFRWNREIDPKLFETTPPDGYIEVTPPEDKKSRAQIEAALRWYADLSGGHYPRIDTYATGAKFDSDAIYAEMLKMAGFDGPERPEWSRDIKYQELRQTKPGLDWIAKIVLNSTAGYHGAKVGSQDKDKVLLWWEVWNPDGYRVFYGDLRTAILTNEEGRKVIAPRPKFFDAPVEGEQGAAEKH